MNKSTSKGEYAQLKVQLKAAEKGFAVAIPTTEEKYDLVVDEAGKLCRVQIKYCDNLSSRKNKFRFELKLGAPSHQRPYYSSKDIDLILVYLPYFNTVLKYDAKIFHKKSIIYIHKNRRSKWFWEKFVW